MSRFSTVNHRASWGGDLPGQQRVRGTGQVDQDQAWQPLSKGTLRVAAMSASGSKKPNLGVKYRRIASRPGP